MACLPFASGRCRQLFAWLLNVQRLWSTNGPNPELPRRQSAERGRTRPRQLDGTIRSPAKSHGPTPCRARANEPAPACRLALRRAPRAGVAPAARPAQAVVRRQTGNDAKLQFRTPIWMRGQSRETGMVLDRRGNARYRLRCLARSFPVQGVRPDQPPLVTFVVPA